MHREDPRVRRGGRVLGLAVRARDRGGAPADRGDRKPALGQRGHIQADDRGRRRQRLEPVPVAPGLELAPVAGVRAGRVQRLGGGGVALGVLEQLSELGRQVRGQLSRKAGKARVDGEHRLGVDGLDRVGLGHPARGL